MELTFASLMARADLRARCKYRPTHVSVSTEGEFMKHPALWTAVQHKLPILFVIPRNGAYTILKSFAHIS
jgi:thiamine pyrophosphate-dependent acetolactate synthase large subunit-like protein